MFQYEFFLQKKLVKNPSPTESFPEHFIKLQEIEWIRPSYWAEHCLECGEPLCYETCPNYLQRSDKRCSLFYYGIYDNPYFQEAPYHAEIKFRKWAKLETIVYPGALLPNKAIEIHDEWKEKSIKKAKLYEKDPYAWLCSIKKRRRFDGEKYAFCNTVSKDNPQDTFNFLLQLYSYEKEPFILFFDITNDDELVYRESITLYPGYNQNCFDVKKVFEENHGKLRTRMYPAADAEVTVVFLFNEFVKLKECAISKVYPMMAKEEKPAKKVKCVAWDLDNTVWHGVLIESDPNSLVLRDGVMDMMRSLDQRGIIQIVVSKNTKEDVLPVLERLGILDYFIYVLANWDAKSSNLKLGAKLLDIGINTFALIDDSIFERNEVAYTLPMVRTYDEFVIQKDTSHYLLNDDAFNVPVTADSVNRRSMYQIEAKRQKAAESTAGNNLEFLKSCNLCATLSNPMEDDELLRSYELLQRTNQLNLSGNKYEKDEFYKHVEKNRENCFILKCEDRFGSYGQVAYLEVKIDEEQNKLLINEFAMSCRVARKYVESALMSALFEHFSETVKKIEFIGKKTSRNGLLLQTFTSIGFNDFSDEVIIRLVCEDKEQLNNYDIVNVVNKIK